MAGASIDIRIETEDFEQVRQELEKVRLMLRAVERHLGTAAWRLGEALRHWDIRQGRHESVHVELQIRREHADWIAQVA